MDRFAAMIILLGVLVSLVLMLLALFAMAPIICSCLVGLLYFLYLFMAYEESGVHHAQEFENRFWTLFALLLSTALLFARDSPIAFGLWSPTLGFLCIVVSGYAMHLWDRYLHRIAMSQEGRALHHFRSGRSSQQQQQQQQTVTTSQSLVTLQDLGIPVSAQLDKINECLTDIDQLLIPSTINNLINQRYILGKEREIISIINECDARALNYLISHAKLGLLFYKIKDHSNIFNGKNRTELINLLAVERLPILTVISRVILLHSLQLLKLRANPLAEQWVRNILLNTHQDDLSELKTLMDAKGDYFCMNKLIYDDIRSESVRQDILNHIRREAAIQQTHMQMGTGRSSKQKDKKRAVNMQWRKVLSDVDDTLLSSGGMYPAGVDKRYAKKVVYPGVLAFYRELDLGTRGPEEWEDDHVGNLVFLSARPHVYRDMSEKQNYAKFAMLRAGSDDGRKGMHTMPSLLAGDLASGSQYLVTNDFEPLAKKKFDNFQRYVSIYPEFQHVFVCDNGQGDVRAGEMMFDSFPYEFEAMYVHIVQDLEKTYGYAPDRWRQKEFTPYFFRSYPDAALHAASRNPPLIRIKGLQRICHEAVKDFMHIKNWASEQNKALRRQELNQAIWRANDFLRWRLEEPVELIRAEQLWTEGQKVRTPYGIGVIRGFEPVWDLYDVELDWRPLDVQVKEYLEEKNAGVLPRSPGVAKRQQAALRTVVETDDEEAAVIETDDEEADVLVGGGGMAATAAIGEGNANEEPVLVPERMQIQQVGESSAERPENDIPRRFTAPVSASPRTPVPHSWLSDAVEETPDISTPDSQRKTRKDAPTERKDARSMTFKVSAQISGRFISRYSPPSLPKLDSKSGRGSIFLFLGKTPEAAKGPSFKVGEELITPYGPATVVEYREKKGIVVVDMIGWKARAYLQQDTLKRMPKSLLGSFLRQFSSSEKETSSQKPPEFPYAHGTIINTPYGEGTVTKPLPPSPPKVRSERSPAERSEPTIGISLGHWTLANGKHPVLYCTVDTARTWKDHKAGDGTSIFESTLSTLVTSSRKLLEPFRVEKPTQAKAPKLFERYYKDSAAVSTPYGDGRVICFRHSDGFYEISLTQWTLANGSHPKAFLRKDDINYRIAKGCQEGLPVLTSLGLSGTLASVEPTTGVHIVTVPSAGMVCYLQPESVLRPLKAAVGEDVQTPYGEGKVLRYSLERDMYTISLAWNATLYTKGNTFDRVGDGVQDRDGRFGSVDWLFRFLFFRTDPPRSRSNSVISATHTTSSRSVN